MAILLAPSRQPAPGGVTGYRRAVPRQPLNIIRPCRLAAMSAGGAGSIRGLPDGGLDRGGDLPQYADLLVARPADHPSFE